jgi:hypothetical protein
LHKLSAGICKSIARRALRLVDGDNELVALKDSGKKKVETIIVGKGLHTMSKSKNMNPGKGGIVGPILLHYVKDELKRDCIIDPKNENPCYSEEACSNNTCFGFPLVGQIGYCI